MTDYGFNPRYGYSEGPGQAPDFNVYLYGLHNHNPYANILSHGSYPVGVYPGVPFDPYYPPFIPVADGPFPPPPGQVWAMPWGGIPGAGPAYPMGPYGGRGDQAGWPDRADHFDGGVPGINVNNALGGIGLPPGYNYLFHDEHTEIKVIRSEHPPWEFEEGVGAGGNAAGRGLWGGDMYGGTGQMQPRYIENFMVPSNATVGKVMERFGCDNVDKKKNMIHEVVQGGNGKWYRGITINGDDKDRCKKTITEMGWGSKRNGVDEDAVWLWMEK